LRLQVEVPQNSRIASRESSAHSLMLCLGFFSFLCRDPENTAIHIDVDVLDSRKLRVECCNDAYYIVVCHGVDVNTAVGGSFKCRSIQEKDSDNVSPGLYDFVRMFDSTFGSEE
jgi:hypothetical protein